MGVACYKVICPGRLRCWASSSYPLRLLAGGCWWEVGACGRHRVVSKNILTCDPCGITQPLGWDVCIVTLKHMCSMYASCGCHLEGGIRTLARWRQVEHDFMGFRKRRTLLIGFLSQHSPCCSAPTRAARVPGVGAQIAKICVPQTFVVHLIFAETFAGRLVVFIFFCH